MTTPPGPTGSSSAPEDEPAPPPADGGRGAHWRRRPRPETTQGRRETGEGDQAGEGGKGGGGDIGDKGGKPDKDPPGAIGVLRIGHRPGRDKRITTHVCLSARAFGADVVYIHEADPRVAAAVEDVVERFGGPFEVRMVDSWRKVVRAWVTEGAQIVHLTMYGLPIDEALTRLDPWRPTLFVVGAEKVPPELYQQATVNLAVGNQPHSELAAIAVVLDRFLGGSWAGKTFAGRVQVSPRERGKAVSPRGTS